jgi:hypothetical protein
MNNQSLFLIMSVIFVIASNMDYEDAERLRAANRAETAKVTATHATLKSPHRA